MKTFDDLVFKPHKATLNSEAKEQLIAAGISEDSDIFSEMTQALITFDNGYKMSVIFGKMFYSNGVDTYEAWCKAVEDDPKGYLSKEEVTGYMQQIQKLGSIK